MSTSISSLSCTFLASSSSVVVWYSVSYAAHTCAVGMTGRRGSPSSAVMVRTLGSRLWRTGVRRVERRYTPEDFIWPGSA